MGKGQKETEEKSIEITEEKKNKDMRNRGAKNNKQEQRRRR